MPTRLPFVLLTFAAVALVATGCSRYSDFAAEPANGDNPAHGNAAVGAVALRTYGCSSCHSIPGIEGPRAMVGPPLDHLANRVYLAGQLPNNPANLVHWIERPHDIHPDTVMPNMDLPDRDARDIAAYLYTLR
jgi:cytochrome c1